MRLHKKFAIALLSVTAFVFVMPVNAPAALIWRKGEGWTWEHEGVTTGTNPSDQLKIAQGLQAKKQYRNAIDAYRRVISRWPLSLATTTRRFSNTRS